MNDFAFEIHHTDISFVFFFIRQNQIDGLRRIAQSLQVKSLFEILATTDDAAASDDALSDNDVWAASTSSRPFTDLSAVGGKKLRKRKSARLSSTKSLCVPILTSDSNVAGPADWTPSAHDPLGTSSAVATQNVKIECQTIVDAIDETSTDCPDDSQDNYNPNDDGDSTEDDNDNNGSDGNYSLSKENIAAKYGLKVC